MNAEKYIEHEVKLRVLKEVSADKFDAIDNRLRHMDTKINWVLGVVITSFITPIALHALQII